MRKRFSIPTLGLSGQARAEAGVIATVRDEATGTMLSLHRSGPSLQAVTEIANVVDELGSSWRIVSLSTPTSIFRDLQGTRNFRYSSERNPESRQVSHDPRTNENTLLGLVGRVDLLAPLRTHA